MAELTEKKASPSISSSAAGPLLLDLEQSFLRIPLESLNRAVRATAKTLLKDVNCVSQEINKVVAPVGKRDEREREESMREEEEAGDEKRDEEERLDKLLEQLKGIKASFLASTEEEIKYLERLTTRIALLREGESASLSSSPVSSLSLGSASLGTASSLSSSKQRSYKRKLSSQTEETERQERDVPSSSLSFKRKKSLSWQEQRVNRLILGYLQREGYMDSARSLASLADLPDCIDEEVYEASKVVIEGLRARDCGPALNWCKTYANKLKAANSSFELEVRLQEFIELVRQSKKAEAMAYAQSYLSPLAQSNVKTLQIAMAALILENPAESPLSEYRAMFAPDRWEELAQRFIKESTKVTSISSVNEMLLALECGLSVLNTPLCHEESTRQLRCPSCTKEGREIAKGLPLAHHALSSLLCSATGEAMDGHNPPMALPNGQVYGRKMVLKSAAENNGMVICPKTGQKFALSEAVQVYII